MNSIVEGPALEKVTGPFLTIETYTSNIDFIVYEVDKLIDNIQNTKNLIDFSYSQNIQRDVLSEPNKCSDTLRSWNSLNIINNLLLVGNIIGEATEIVKKPLEALSAIFVKELIDNTISEEWQKKFER